MLDEVLASATNTALFPLDKALFSALCTAVEKLSMFEVLVLNFFASKVF